jgi:CRISPR-associated protein Csy2
VIAHHADEQSTTDQGFVNSFRLTRNPVDQSGSTAAIVEEGRIHLDLSLVFAVQSQALQDSVQQGKVAAQVHDLVSQMRIAGGTVIPSNIAVRRRTPWVVAFTGDQAGQQTLFRQLKMRLLPGFALVERQDLLEQRYQQLLAANSTATKLDAWLSLSRINWSWQSEGENADKGKWQHDRQGLGWTVPIPLGYGALTPLQAPGSVANTRDTTTPFRFVESLYGIGQWVSPHRLQSPQQLLWYADNQPDAGLYRCRNDFHVSPIDQFETDFS